jgi:hypothetical protein
MLTRTCNYFPFSGVSSGRPDATLWVTFRRGGSPSGEKTAFGTPPHSKQVPAGTYRTSRPHLCPVRNNRRRECPLVSTSSQRGRAKPDVKLPGTEGIGAPLSSTRRALGQRPVQYTRGITLLSVLAGPGTTGRAVATTHRGTRRM